MKRLAQRGLVISLPMLLLMCSMPTGAWADSSTQRYESIRDSYLSLREDRDRQRFRHNYLQIIELFESFVEDHPRHERAPAALYNAASLAWDLYRVSRVAADLSRARQIFVRLADEYPDSNLADDGLFLSGRILLEHGGDIGEAREVFRSVIRRFPDGDMVPKAREMLDQHNDYAEEIEASTTIVGDESPGQAPRVIARSGSWQGVAGEGSARVSEPEIKVADSLLRIIIPVSGSVSFREGEVPADSERGLPRRIYFDLRPASLNAPLDERSIDSGIISRVRLGQFAPDIVRLVLDLHDDTLMAVYPLFAEGSLVIDVSSADQPVPDPVVLLSDISKALSGGVSGEHELSSEDLRASSRERLGDTPEIPLSVQAGLKVRRIVIDPGHGGHDVGAVGPGGLKEKDVALSISKKLGEKLLAHGLEVIYTRTEDVFVRLEDRTVKANNEEADLFISVHANAATRRDRRGVTTYYLDVTSDRYSMRLAARENQMAERSVGELQLILADLTTRHNTDESRRLAGRIQSNLVQTLSGKYSDVRDLGVQYALFYVLLGARMPSVLVETSFLSNPVEERRLRSTEYREKVAEGIFEGVLAFIEDRERLALGD